MIHLENSILIERPIDEVFLVATDVSRWREFLPSHKDMKIIAQEEDKILIEWKMKVRLMTSIFIDRVRKIMVSEQTLGLTKGLRAEYSFKDLSNKTELSLKHCFESKLPLIGRIIEMMTLRHLKRLSPDTLRRIKERAEEKRCSMD